MVGNTGRAADPRRIRRLKPPRAIEIEEGEGGRPLRVLLHGVWSNVQPAHRPWRIDQYWWRADPIRRIYYRLEIENGPPLTVYYDEVAKAWFRQEY